MIAHQLIWWAVMEYQPTSESSSNMTNYAEPTTAHVVVTLNGEVAKCMWCGKSITYTSDPEMLDKPGTVYSPAGLREVEITSSCEICFDSMFSDEEVTEDESDDEMVMDIPKADLPGMWEASDVSGGEADTANDMKRDREYDPGYQHAVETRYDEGRAAEHPFRF